MIKSYYADTERKLSVETKSDCDLRIAILRPISEEKKQNVGAMIDFLQDEKHNNYYF